MVNMKTKNQMEYELFVKNTKHELKTITWYFEHILNEGKNFEVRLNDRDYKVGNKLILKEWDGEKFTGRVIEKEITYILRLNQILGEYHDPTYWSEEKLQKYGIVILGMK